MITPSNQNLESLKKKKRKKKKEKWCFKVKLCCLLGLVSSVYVNENL